MKKFFLNKKLMALVLSLCLVLVIGGIGALAAWKSGLPGITMLKEKIPTLGEKETEISQEPTEPENTTPKPITIDPIGISPVEPQKETEQPADDRPIVYAAPERMMAVTVEAGKDFYTDPKMSVSDMEASIEKMLKSAKDLSANTVFVRTGYEGKVLFTSEGTAQVESSLDLLRCITDKAKEMDFYVYTVLDIDGSEDTAGEKSLSILEKDVEALCAYDVDGIMLDSYTLSSDGEAYAGYLENGGGMGYENFLNSRTEASIKTAYAVAKRADPSVAVGLAVDAVWANGENQEGGSDTTADFESLTGGFADTKKFVEKGLADFVSVKCTYATTDKSAKFKNYLTWWSDVVAEKVPLYIFQYATKACTEAKGWKDPSELSDQVIAAEKMNGFCGSIFDSLSALKENPKQSTDALIQYLTENIDPSFLLTQLEMTRPSKKTYSTYENVVTFAGASDVNFDLFLNGEKVKRDSNGAFMLTIDLKTGLNTFTFTHKEKTITYNITRNIKILKEITPLGNMTIGGGMSVTVTALAYEGSTVTASLGSSTISLKPSTEADDATDNESTYKIYSGMITVPAATGSEQKLGNIKVVGKWNDAPTETLEGAFVTVSQKAAAGGLVEVVASAAETFPCDTLNDLSDYDCYPLAKGTRDYIVGDEIVYVEGDKTYTYYNLQSGQRVYTKDVVPVAGELGGNKIQNMTVSSNARYTYVSFEMDQQVAYIAKYSSSAFTIDFRYTDSVPGDLNLNCTPLFDSATWSGSKLTLKLSTTSGFLGYFAYYESGSLIFRFNNPTGSYSLSGVPIVVDVGHSALGVGALGYLSAYGEYEINLAVGKYLKSELQSRGATVYMMDTVNSRPSLEDRTTYASSKHPLAFVSVHCNSSTTSTGYGTECFYFTRFSSPLATYFSDNVSSALGTANRGGRIGRYYVTRVQDYPAILGEIGFVSNESDYYKLIQNSYQRSIASGIADAVQSYLGSIGRNGNYSYGTQSTGGSSYEAPPLPEEEPENSEPEEEIIEELPNDSSASDSSSSRGRTVLG